MFHFNTYKMLNKLLFHKKIVLLIVINSIYLIDKLQLLSYKHHPQSN